MKRLDGIRGCPENRIASTAYGTLANFTAVIGDVLKANAPFGGRAFRLSVKLPARNPD
jgi:hypothetical protein